MTWLFHVQEQFPVNKKLLLNQRKSRLKWTERNVRFLRFDS